MEVSSLLSLPEGLRVERIEPQGDLLAIAVVSVRPSSCCPLCAQASSQVHSQYRRTLRDVACGGRKVVLHLCVRTFFCRNPACARKIFTERLPTFVEPWAQVTTRLFEAVQAIGLADFRGTGNTTGRPHRVSHVTHHRSWPHHGSGSLLIPTGCLFGDRRLVLSAGSELWDDSRGFNHPHNPRFVT